MADVFGMRVDLEMYAKNLDKVKKQVDDALNSAGMGGKSGGSSSGVGKVFGKMAGSLAIVAATVLAMKGIMNGVLGTLRQASPALAGTFRIMEFAKNQFFRPFGDYLSQSLRPLSGKLLEMSSEFIKFSRTEEGGDTIQDIVSGAIGAFMGSSFFGIIGGIMGFISGGPAGAALGYGAGVAIGGIAGGISGKTASDIQQFFEDYVGDIDKESKADEIAKKLDDGTLKGVDGIIEVTELAAITLGKGLTGGMTMLGDSVKNLAGTTDGFISDGIETLGDSIGLLSPWAGESFKLLLTEVWDSIREAASGLFGTPRKMSSSIHENAFTGQSTFNPSNLNKTNEQNVKITNNLTLVPNDPFDVVAAFKRNSAQQALDLRGSLVF